MLWGSAQSTIKVGYELFAINSGDTYSQILFAGARFFIAGILVVIAGSVQNRGLLLPCKDDTKPILVLALFQTVLQYVPFYIGLAHASAARASIINGMNPFVSIVIAVCIFRFEKMDLRSVIGCMMGLAGIVLMETVGQTVTFGFSWNGEGLIMMTVLSSAISANFIKLFGREHDPVLLSGYQFMTGGAFMIIISLAAGARLHFTASGSLLLLYLAFISSAAYTLWGIILKYHPVSNVTVFNSLTPVIGVILSAILLDEKSALSLFTLLALVLVSLGIIIVSNDQG